MIRFAVYGVLALALAACDAPAKDDFSRVNRAVESPDGGATAGLARIASGGAAGSLAYKVYLSETGSDGDPELVFHGYSDCNPEIEWRSSELLVIRYAGGNCQVQAFHNFWKERERKRAETKTSSVEIMLERVMPVAPDVWNPR